MADYPPPRGGRGDYPPPSGGGYGPRGGAGYNDYPPPRAERGYGHGPPPGYGAQSLPPPVDRRGPPPGADAGRGGPPRTTLFVAGFPPEMRAADLAYYFERLGPLVRCDIPALKSIQSKPYAFVEYEDPRDAAAAHAEMHGVRFGGHAISLQFAKNAPSANWRFDVPGAGGRGPPPPPPAARRRRSPSPGRRAPRGEYYDDRGYSRGGPAPPRDDRDRYNSRRGGAGERDFRGSDRRGGPPEEDRQGGWGPRRNGDSNGTDRRGGTRDGADDDAQGGQTGDDDRRDGGRRDEVEPEPERGRENALTPPPAVDASINHHDEEREPVDVADDRE